MKALGLNQTSVRIDTPKQKEASSLNATNLKVFLCVIAILAAAAAVSVWQMNVGGTGNWITFTLTGTSGALLLGIAIHTALAYCRQNAEKKKTASHSTTAAPKAQSLPRSTVSNPSSEASTPNGLAHSRTISALQSPSASENVSGTRTVSVFHATSADASSISGSAGAASKATTHQTKPTASEEGLPSAKKLKEMGKNPLDWHHEYSKGSTYLGLAVTSCNESLIQEYFTQFPWFLTEGDKDYFATCTIKRTYQYLLPTTPKPILDLFSKKLLELIKTEIELKKYEPNPKDVWINIPFPQNGIMLITEEMIRDVARCPFPKVFGNLLLAYPHALPADLRTSHREQVEAHEIRLKKIELQKLCKEGGNLETMIKMMTECKMGPRTSFETGWPGDDNVLSLLIESGHVKLVDAFIPRWQTPPSITPADIKLARDKGKPEMATFLEGLAQQEQVRKDAAFAQIADMITRTYPETAYNIRVAHENSGLKSSDVAMTGPHKGKTILQLVVERGHDSLVHSLMQDLEADKNEWGHSNGRHRVGNFFLGNASDNTLGQLRCVGDLDLPQLKAKKKQDVARVNALKECATLASDSKNESKILQLMREHGLQPDTMFHPMTLDQTPLAVAADGFTRSQDLHKTFVMMLNGKEVTLELPAIHEYGTVSRRFKKFADCGKIHFDDLFYLEPGSTSLLQRCVEANLEVLVTKIVASHLEGVQRYPDRYKNIDTSKYFLAGCSDAVLSQLALISTEAFAALKARQANDAIVAPIAKLAVLDANKAAVLQQLVHHKLTPDVTCGQGKMLVEVVAFAGKPAIETLKALVEQLKGRKVISKAVFDSYASELDPASAAQLKLVVEEDIKADK